MARHITTREQKAAGLDSRSERMICTGLVVSDRVCREVSQIPGVENLFVADFTGWVGRTALAHWRKHKEPIGRHIEDAHHLARREGRLDGSAAALVSEFLGGISGEYERGQFNEGYVVQEIALPYFRMRGLRTMCRETEALLDAGRLDDAEMRREEYRKVELATDEGHDLFEDRDLHKRAYAQQDQPLFTIPGAIGRLLAPQLHRKNFVSVRGVVGKGKSYILMELAKWASRGRCNVLMIGVGDMSDEDYALRMSVNLAGRSNDPRDCESNWVPCVDCALNQDGSCRKGKRLADVELPAELREAQIPDPNETPRGYKPCALCMYDRDFQGAPWWRMREACNPLTENDGWKAMQRFRRRLRGRHFKLTVYPSKAITPTGLDTKLRRLYELEDWLPDVVVIDYMDEMGSDAQPGEAFRHREADKWSKTRGLWMKWNALGLVAEQSDAQGYEQETLGLDNFNEDRRRNDVVTGLLGYNRTSKDESRGVARLAWAGKIRNSSFTRRDQAVICQDLSCGRPLLGSWWRRWPKQETE